jgi:limonene-1,2-epoxide hydrolase
MMAVHQKRDMRDHLRVVQEITAALSHDDFDAIIASTARMPRAGTRCRRC